MPVSGFQYFVRIEIMAKGKLEPLAFDGRDGINQNTVEIEKNG